MKAYVLRNSLAYYRLLAIKRRLADTQVPLAVGERQTLAEELASIIDSLTLEIVP